VVVFRYPCSPRPASNTGKGECEPNADQQFHRHGHPARIDPPFPEQQTRMVSDEPSPDPTRLMR
jgi:hypothetical protein